MIQPVALHRNLNILLSGCMLLCADYPSSSFSKIKRAFIYTSLLFLLMGIMFQTSAQTTSGLSKKILTANFLFPEVEYTEIAVLSNVLRVKNNTGKKVTFTITISHPTGWRTLNKSEKEYTLAPDDSLFMPVRLLTNNRVAKGGTKYNITAFVTTSEGRQAGLASFRAGRPKTKDWDMHVLPRPRIYFLNGENSASFQ